MEIQKVILVDDDPDIRTVGELSLGQIGGWNVTTAASGMEALEKIGEADPDVILLDVMMPDMDGPSTFAKMREIESFANTPVIFITAKVQRQEVERYFSLGASGCIGKPFDPMTLPAEISEILRDF